MPVPAPNFNLFRSASVYSTASDASDLTFLSEDADTASASSNSPPLAPFSGLNLGDISGLTTPRAETPSTPRGIKPGQGYFDAWAPVPATATGVGAAATAITQAPIQGQGWAQGQGDGAGQCGSGVGQQAVAGPSRLPVLTSLPVRTDSRRIPSGGKDMGRTADKEEEEGDGQATPKKGFVVRSRPTVPIEPMAPLVQSRQPSLSVSEHDHDPDLYTALPSGRSLAETHAHAQASKLAHSHIHGVAPDAHAGTVPTHLPTRQSISGEDWESIHGEQGSEWGDEGTGEEEDGIGQLAGDGSGGDGFEAGAGSPMLPAHHSVQPQGQSGQDHGQEEQRPTAWLVTNPSSHTTQTQASRKTKRNIIIPRRAAPPPPPGPGTPQNASGTYPGQLSSASASSSASSNMPMYGDGRLHRMDRRASDDTTTSSTTVASSSSGERSGIGGQSRQALQPRWPNETEGTYAHNGVFDPARLPDSSLALAADSYSGKQDKGKGVAGRSPNLQIHTDRNEQYARPGSGSSGDTRTTHTQHRQPNGNGQFPDFPSPEMRYASNGNRTPSMDSLRAGGDVLLAKGLQAKANEDLAKAAWYYKQSADAGNSTGRMYWGESLRMNCRGYQLLTARSRVETRLWGRSG